MIVTGDDYGLLVANDIAVVDGGKERITVTSQTTIVSCPAAAAAAEAEDSNPLIAVHIPCGVVWWMVPAQMNMFMVIARAITRNVIDQRDLAYFPGGSPPWIVV